MILQGFSKYATAIHVVSLTGSKIHGSGFDLPLITNAGFAQGAASDQLVVKRKGRYLILVSATVTNNSTTNNQNTGFTISATETVNVFASRPGTDTSVSIPLAGFSYLDATIDVPYNTGPAGTLIQVLAYGAGGNTITVVSGYMIVMKINGEVDGEMEI